MKGFSLLLLVSVGLLAACQKKEKPATPAEPPKATAESSSGNPIAAPVEYVAAVGRAGQHAVKHIDLAALKQAINMFQVTEGRYPKDLNELVTKGTMRQLPPPPAGMEIKYDPNTGNVTIVKK